MSATVLGKSVDVGDTVVGYVVTGDRTKHKYNVRPVMFKIVTVFGADVPVGIPMLSKKRVFDELKIKYGAYVILPSGDAIVGVDVMRNEKVSKEDLVAMTVNRMEQHAPMFDSVEAIAQTIGVNDSTKTYFLSQYGASQAVAEYLKTAGEQVAV